MNKKYVKGEIVIAHGEYNNQSRYPDYRLMVVSVGKKHISCQPLSSDGQPLGHIEQFNIETLLLKDWSAYRLYHNEEEIKEEEKRVKMLKDFKLDLERNAYSLEELMLFKEIHELGIEKWKEINSKQND